jgi:hypothetical protein
VRLDVGQSHNDVTPTGLIARFDAVQLAFIGVQPQAVFLFADAFE